MAGEIADGSSRIMSSDQVRTGQAKATECTGNGPSTFKRPCSRSVAELLFGSSHKSDRRLGHAGLASSTDCVEYVALRPRTFLDSGAQHRDCAGIEFVGIARLVVLEPGCQFFGVLQNLVYCSGHRHDLEGTSHFVALTRDSSG